MDDDLQHAQASVDWAKSNLPTFQKRLNAWLHDNVRLAIRHQPSDVPNDVVVTEEKEPLPLSFQVEAGIYLNAIRSSLDILAYSLANRHCQTFKDDAYFPIAASAAIFISGKGFKGYKFVQSLPAKERGIIESLKPYKGKAGNNTLCALHDLDILRKHARLLSVDTTTPRIFVVSGSRNALDAFIPIHGGWARTGTGPNETTIGLIVKNAPHKPHIKFTPQICLTETDYFPRREVITTLREFASLANSIINLFDFS
ncbi:MAG TPA: hypothetical protein VLZ74_09580 [Methylocella sp.]|nr:hypothetical protein [Methylocella sp.]